ncbi:MAG: hypothetical protein H6710_17505 [Myxococcales bacterium]|nr:hypothetical protein [Myxococcales bacterium]
MRRRDPLDVVVADARTEVRARVDAGGRVRDFAAMIARARALDPAAISAASSAEAAGYAPVVALAQRQAAVDEGPPEVRPASRWAASQGRWLGRVAALLLLGFGLAGAVELARREAQPLPAAALRHHDAAPSERATLGGVRTSGRVGEGGAAEGGRWLARGARGAGGRGARARGCGERRERGSGRRGRRP